MFQSIIRLANSKRLVSYDKKITYYEWKKVSNYTNVLRQIFLDCFQNI